jgi:hypothetical protein
MPYQQACVMDIEASGFGRRSYPIEIGYVRDDGQAWCSLVRPAADWKHWDKQAERVHGIARPALLQHGRTVYCDGWAHDYAWLGLLFEEAGLVPRFKLESVNRLLDDASLARLDAERQRAFAVLGIGRHRASSDARALQWALEQLAA